jgi:hypothetical protein
MLIAFLTGNLAGEITTEIAGRQSGWTWIFLPVKQVIPRSAQTGLPPWYIVQVGPQSRDYYDYRTYLLWLGICLVLCTVGATLGWTKPKLGVRIALAGFLLAQAPLFYTFWGAGGLGAAGQISAIAGAITAAGLLVIAGRTVWKAPSQSLA